MSVRARCGVAWLVVVVVAQRASGIPPSLLQKNTPLPTNITGQVSAQSCVRELLTVLLAAQIYSRGQPGYDQFRMAHWNATAGQNAPGNVNTLFDTLFPAIIVLAASEADVSSALRYAAPWD